nr:MAG TPA: hypothetical protein [Caudoviricetes sp.]
MSATGKNLDKHLKAPWKSRGFFYEIHVAKLK